MISNKIIVQKYKKNDYLGQKSGYFSIFETKTVGLCYIKKCQIKNKVLNLQQKLIHNSNCFIHGHI